MNSKDSAPHLPRSASGHERTGISPHPPLRLDAGQALYSDLFDDVFKSRAGGLAEARAVFTEGCDLARRWAGREAFTILEIGFGTGANICETIALWRDSVDRPARLHLVSIEKHPLTARDLALALAALNAPATFTGPLLAQWPLPLAGLHRLCFEDNAVTLTLALGDAVDILPRLSLVADAIYLDGFAPARNPALWTDALFRSIARLSRPQAQLATFSSASAVRQGLARAGFEVRVHEGFGGKRRRLTANYAPRRASVPHDAKASIATAGPVPPAGIFTPAAAPKEARHAVVIGAGIAGCAAAAALAERGWAITLLEEGNREISSRRGAGSAQPLLAQSPHLSPDDNPLARLSRTALLLVRRCAWADTTALTESGRLVIASDPSELTHLAAIVAKLGLPAAFARTVDATEASALAGVPLAHGALWLPLVCVAQPDALSKAWLSRRANLIARHWNVRAESLEAIAEGWRVHTNRGSTFEATAVILANAHDAPRLGGQHAIALQSVGGQSTLLAAGALPGLHCALGGAAQAGRLDDGRVLIGSTFDSDADSEPRSSADAENLARLRLVLSPDALIPEASIQIGVRGQRAVARDRMPVIGPLPDEIAIASRSEAFSRNDRLPLPRQRGLYGCFAFGSRGLLWAPLAAEVIAAYLSQEPMPIETDLLRAIDPARFMRHALRRSAL